MVNKDILENALYQKYVSNSLFYSNKTNYSDEIKSYDENKLIDNVNEHSLLTMPKNLTLKDISAPVVIPDEAKEILDIISTNGCEVHIVGGFVRDYIMSFNPSDIDFSTNMEIPVLLELFKSKGYSVIEMALKHNTITVIHPESHNSYEITRYRSENNNYDEDTIHRDFTINTFSINNLLEIRDSLNAYDDLKNHLIKAVDNAVDRIKEDPLRMLRAVRFATQFGFSIDEELQTAIKENAELIENIAAERISKELVKILMSPIAHQGILMLHELGLLKYIIPELDHSFSVPQNNPYHIYNVGGHTLAALKNTPFDLEVRLAILLHDIGKNYIHFSDDKGDHFYIKHFCDVPEGTIKDLIKASSFYRNLDAKYTAQLVSNSMYKNMAPADVEKILDDKKAKTAIKHALVSSLLAKSILEKLRFDNKTIKNVCKLIAKHDVVLYPSDDNIAEFIVKNQDFSDEMFFKFIAVRFADIYGHNPACISDTIEKYKKIEQILEKLLKGPHRFSDLALDGDKIKEISDNGLFSTPLLKGMEINEAQKYLLTKVIENNQLNSELKLSLLLKSNIISIQSKSGISEKSYDLNKQTILDYNQLIDYQNLIFNLVNFKLNDDDSEEFSEQANKRFQSYVSQIKSAEKYIYNNRNTSKVFCRYKFSVDAKPENSEAAKRS